VVEGDKVVVEFNGKGGKQIKQEVEDRSLDRVVRTLTALRGPRLFSAAALASLTTRNGHDSK
jgi:DNA topoisomerase IB